MALNQPPVHKRLPKKLVKKRRQDQSNLQFPKELDLGEDADEDVTTAEGPGAQLFHLNQSVFSLVAAAGSKSNFHNQFDDGESGSDTEQEDSTSISQPSTTTKDQDEMKRAVKSESRRKESAPVSGPHSVAESNSRRESASRRRSESKLLRSLPKVNIRTKKERNYMSQSMILPPKREGSPVDALAATPRDAPIMSRILEAQARLEEEVEDETKIAGRRVAEPAVKEEKKPVSLEQRLKEIFSLHDAEEVVAEYPFWLLQSVLLQVFMYITSKHLCFYAYLPKKSSIVAKSGHLSKRGKQNPRYNRYWFRLQGDVLSYYTDPSDLYFPSGNIDLRYGISATLSDTKEKGKDTKSFTITTPSRVYHFNADSSASAKEWVRTLQKVIFRSHNDGDSVKISLPLQNVVDIEESPVIDFADTFKVRVIDNDETFAIDEYFFSFFSFGKDALNVLRSLVDDTPASRLSADLLSPIRNRSGQSSPHPEHGNGPISPTSQLVFHDSVRATLSPVRPSHSGTSSPRPSSEWPRRSFDQHRKSMDLSPDAHAHAPRQAFQERGRSKSAGRVTST